MTQIRLREAPGDMYAAETPVRTIRIPLEAEQAARDSRPELANVPRGVLVRVALAVLTGTPIAEAIGQASIAPGPKLKPPTPVGA